jgi:hypothetical protein
MAYREFFPGTPIHQPRERREKMAQAVRAGKDVHQVASDFGVGLPAVFGACKQFSVIVEGPVQHSPPFTLRKGRLVTATQWHAADWTQRDSDLARQLGVSRERVRQIRGALGKPRSLFHRRSKSFLKFHDWVNRTQREWKRLTASEIARLYGQRAQPATIEKWCGFLGIQLGPGDDNATPTP